MKLLHITDIHFNKLIFNWIFNERKKYDAICITGDFLSTKLESEISKKEQAQWIVDWLEKFDTPLFICTGNHDIIQKVSDEDFMQQSLDELFFGNDSEFGCFETDDYKIADELKWLKNVTNPLVHSDNTKTSFMGYKIGCVPYSCEDLSYFYDCDILLHHLPPSQTDQSTMNGNDYGCDILKTYIDNNLVSAKYILSGHVHKPQATKSIFRNVWLINPGAKKTLPPKFEVLNLSN